MGRSFREFKEHNVRAGLGTALCYRLSSETKYHILAPVENLPAVFGTPDTIEYSSTTNRNVTNVMGKNSTETVEINLPYNLDYINICSDISGLEVNFAYIDLDDFSGQEFTGTPRYHLADVGTSDIKTIVLSIAVTNAIEDITEDLFNLFEDTVSFLTPVPASIELDKDYEEGTTINIETDPTIGTEEGKVTLVAESNSNMLTATISGSSVVIKPTAAAKALASGDKRAGIVTITATAKGYAPNQRRIKVLVVSA